MIEAYQTQSLSVAATLFTCGVPFFEPEPGKPCPCLNLYTKEILGRMKDPATGKPYYKGWSLDKAAADAWERKRPGEVTYCFKYTPLLAEVLKAYDDQQHAMKEAMEAAENGVMGVPTQTIDVSPSVLATLACQLFKNRITLRDMFEVPVPVIAIYGPTRTEQDGKNKVIISSFKAISLNASPETKAHLNIQI